MKNECIICVSLISNKKNYTARNDKTLIFIKLIKSTFTCTAFIPRHFMQCETENYIRNDLPFDQSFIISVL